MYIRAITSLLVMLVSICRGQALGKVASGFSLLVMLVSICRGQSYIKMIPSFSLLVMLVSICRGHNCRQVIIMQVCELC